MKYFLKFIKLYKYVKAILAYKNRRADTDNPGFTDSTNIRYMVIFSDSAVFSFITFMLFCKKYPNV